MPLRPAPLTAVLDALEAEYGPQTLAGPTDPFQMLVFLMCGYPASDAACTKGFDALKRAAGLRRAKRALQQFPSIGEPGAEKILLFAKIAPVAAVPSGAVDVCSRLWRGEPGKNYTAEYRAAREILAAGLPESFAPRQRAYLLIKKHGQEICKRSTPRCEQCPLTSRCAYVSLRAAD